MEDWSVYSKEKKIINASLRHQELSNLALVFVFLDFIYLTERDHKQGQREREKQAPH